MSGLDSSRQVFDLRAKGGRRDWTASAAGDILGEALAARGAGRIVDANKLNHIFGKAGRNLEPLVEKFGSQEGAFNAVQDATQSLVES